MAKIHGISGSTRYLIKGTRPIHEKKLTTLEEITHFHTNYEKILADAEIAATKRQDEIIHSLSNDEVMLDSQLREKIAIQTVEVDGKINEITAKIEKEENVFVFLGYKLQQWIARSLRSHRIHSPFSHLSRELRNLQSRKSNVIAKKSYVIRDECNNVIFTQKFLTENISFMIGAEGEEHVISVLSQLPDDYHVLNDVNLRFNGYIYWRKGNEHIKTCQIDHIVIGPTGIFLVETKNWKTSDIGKKADDLKHQVQRAGYTLWYYLKDEYGFFGKAPKIRSVVVSLHGLERGQRIDKYIDVVSPHRICGYITSRERILSDEDIHKLIRLIPCSETI